VELNWSTFLLEIVNFLILVWILKRFFFKPVMEVIARRRAGIDQSLADAAALKAEAEKLEKTYQDREASWEREKEQAHETLARELDAQRAKGLAELQTALEQQRRKAQVTEDRRQADLERKLEETALAQAARFATRLLQGTAGPETQAGLIETAITGLDDLDEQRIAKLQTAPGSPGGTVRVSSAYPLTNEQHQRLEQALKRVAGEGAEIRFEHDRELLAGVLISLGAWDLGLNIRDELRGFAELTMNE